MNIVIAVCLVYMLGILVGVSVQLMRTSRKERLKQIKNFRRGKFALIYLAAVPLYFLAYYYNGVGVEGAVWGALKSSVDSVLLKFDFSAVSALMDVNLFYKITTETAFILIGLNAVMFSVSFGGQRLLNAVSFFFTRLCRRRIIVVVGHNPNSLDILKSAKEAGCRAVLMGEVSPELRDDAFDCHADYVNLSGDDDFGKRIAKLFFSFRRKKVYVILNCEDDAVSLRYVKQLCNMIVKKNLNDMPLTEPYGLQAFVFADKINETAFAHYEKASYGLVQFINRHEQIAKDFIEQHPMTEFMTENQLDFATATVKPEVDLNVFMIGFGKLNESLFLTSVSNNQFLTKGKKGPEPKIVTYHLYDRMSPEGKITKENESIESRSLHHGYMRYKEFLKEDAAKNKYLELVPEPAEIKYHSCDISHPDFYASLQDALKKEHAYSYVIISFGSDIENIELAEKLQQKFHEWKVPSFVKIFVKVRDKKLLKEIDKDFTADLIEFFGTNRDAVYNAKKIISEDTLSMARLRHLFYTAENYKREKEREKKELGQEEPEEKELGQEELERSARDYWYLKYTQFQRESNVFACLSIRMKLQLFGYDYVKEKMDKDDSEDFEREYQEGDERQPSDIELEGKTVWDYTNKEQERSSVRHTFAVQEHLRWCANMICNGVIPLPEEEIGQRKGRNLDQRLHGALTTMDGLVKYRELIADYSGKTTEDTDLIRYDYQLMDDVVWLLHRHGYSIVRSKNGANKNEQNKDAQDKKAE